MWYAIYDEITGTLVSTGSIVSTELPDGLLSKSFQVDHDISRWNSSTLEFDLAIMDVVLAPQDFMDRFTFAEEAAIRYLARTDPVMETFLARASRALTVSLSHPDTINGINYCVAHGCITEQRALEILNG